MTIIEQVTVYADVTDPSLLELVKSNARKLHKDAKVCQVSNEDSRDPLAFLHLWEKEKENTLQNVQNNVPYVRRFECFVTDSKTEHSGAVAYALYCRRMPVLSLVEADGAAVTDGDDAGEDWVLAALYQSAAFLRCEPSAAIEAFFSFPTESGKLCAVEGECAALVMSQCRLLCDHARSVWKARVILTGSNGCDIAADGYAEGTEVEAAHFTQLINELLGNERYRAIREANPQLHGALCALNRHHNFSILRYRLQRGVNVVMCRPLSPFLDNLFTEFVQVGADERSLQESFITVVRSLLHFEGHWLGLPQSEVLLIRVTEDGGAGTAVSNASSSLDTPPRRWSTWLGGGEGSKSDVSPVGWRTIDICTSGCSDSVSLNSEVINSVQHLFTRAWE